MIKKYKSSLVTTVISIVFLIAIYVLMGHVYSALYNPSNETQFMTVKASKILGKELYMASPVWTKLENAGMLGCFWHKESGYSDRGMSNRIHSVFDISFDTDKGVMKAYSILNEYDANKKRIANTSYADESSTIGRLAAETARTNNALNVQKALYHAISEGAVVNESAIIAEMDWSDPNVQQSNPASTSEINKYSKYKKIQDTEECTPTEKSATVKINGINYVVIGKFKIKFGGEGIKKITIGNAKWESSSSTDIYYTTNSLSSDSITWRKNFNATKSGKYTLNNKKFYIAVREDKLPSGNQYTVKIEQNSFKYHNARIVVCVGSSQQQTGMYLYDNAEHTVDGEVSWTITRRLNNYIIIKKLDEKTGNELFGAGFKIYAELDDGTKGWVSGTAGDTKTYGNVSSATQYQAKVAITGLKYGKYYIYETLAPDGYDLTGQNGYKKEAAGSNELTGNWAYVGSKVLNAESQKIAVNIKNKKMGTLEISKVDEQSKKVLSGAKFKIYAKLVDGTAGWVSGNISEDKTYGTTMTEYDSNKEISNLKNGTYYIYETKGPDDEKYALSAQKGYLQESEGSKDLTGEWVYLGEQVIDTNNGDVTFEATNRESKSLKILKEDEKTGKELEGAAFKIYAELDDGTSGWVSGDADGVKTYGETASEYPAKVEIKNLSYGIYSIYETKAPEGYDLSVQKGYLQGSSETSSLTGDWVYIDSKDLSQENVTITVKAINRLPKTLEILKLNEKTEEELEGAAFKIYAELDDGTKGWLSGNAADKKNYGKTASEYAAKVEIKNLRYGKYYVYETKAPNGCILSEQTGYKKDAPGSSSLDGEWVYLGSTELNSEGDTKITVIVKNKPLAAMEIVKKDSKTGTLLSGGKFKIYAVLNNGEKGWLSGDAAGDKTYGGNASEYSAGTRIEKLKYGTYYVYETQTPKGYSITGQDGYHKEAEGSNTLTGDWVYLGNQVVDSNFKANEAFKFEALNKKILEGIEGDVWIDEPETKAGAVDSIYKSGTKDYLKEGITVNLYDGTDTLIATTKTDAKGHYKFTTKNAESYTGSDKGIYYWDLADLYVEFIYNNKTTYNDDFSQVTDYGYVTVDPFAGTDAKVNSKAQASTITTAQLNDNNLTGTDGANPGKARTVKNVLNLEDENVQQKIKEVYEKIKNNTATEDDLKDASLAYYYDEDTNKVSAINLGLREQYDANISVEENLAYIKVSMKGYTYTYKYGDSPVTTSTNVPTVNEQNSKKSYTGSIYPTDIAYNVAHETEELKVYVVYSVNVRNSETMNIDSVYREQRLYLDENGVQNTFDTDRFELCNNENNSDKSDFALWRADGNGRAVYDVYNENSAYKDGIGQLETKTSYIQFKVKDEALRKLLETGTDENQAKAATVATAKGYHEYLRTDNAWEHNSNVRAFEGAKGVSNYPTVNGVQKKYYAHRTISKADNSGELFLKLHLGDPRTISGTVFEDTKTNESVNNNTNLGNGVLDNDEANRAQNVTVELLDADKTTVSKLYKVENHKVVYTGEGELPEASTSTEVGGTYTFEGVVPGYYYIRFTYGDGSQKLMPAGTSVESRDYRSTIINTDANGAGDTIKNAMEAKAEDLVNIRDNTTPINQTEAQKKIVEWYKYLNNNSYSTAVDDLAQRSITDKYEYRDNGKVYDESGKEVTNYPSNINAYTPMTSISIENDVDTFADEGNVHKSSYTGFNFGIIEQANTDITPEKEVTNIEFTTQTGTTLVSANPTDKDAPYVSALDKINGGSKAVKMEMEANMIYGSELKTTYQITIANKSDKDYIEPVNSDKYGTYYKYGQITEETMMKKVTVNQVVDELDEKYKTDQMPTTIGAKVKHSDGSVDEDEVTVVKENEDGTAATTKTVKLEGWSSLESGESETVEYTVKSLLSADDSTNYANRARITSISLDKLSTLKNNFEWKADNTNVTITPPTGSDRSGTYWFAGIIGLSVLAGGIVLIKRKLLNK